jgi:hypothetical protein
VVPPVRNLGEVDVPTNTVPAAPVSTSASTPAEDIVTTPVAAVLLIGVNVVDPAVTVRPPAVTVTPPAVAVKPFETVVVPPNVGELGIDIVNVEPDAVVVI